jgi:hypothetical protein
MKRIQRIESGREWDTSTEPSSRVDKEAISAFLATQPRRGTDVSGVNWRQLAGSLSGKAEVRVTVENPEGERLGWTTADVVLAAQNVMPPMSSPSAER